MSIANTKSYVSDLLTAGNDAFSNLYEVVLSFPNGFADSSDGTTFSMRCKGFTPPQINGGEKYRVFYVDTFVDWPSARVEITRTFDLTFRVDSNYQAYKKLHELVKSNFNPNEDYVNTDLTDLEKTSFTTTVRSVTTGSSAAKESEKIDLYKFKNCIVTGVTPVEFVQGTANQVEATATFIFGDMEDLQTSV